MFERFTDRARRVVVTARQEAALLDHDYIGPEHILLGLIHEDAGVAAKALVALGIDLAAVRQRVEESVGRGNRPPPGPVPFNPQAKHILELSLREALQLGHNYVGTEHILLGLIREDDDVAARILAEMGADNNSVHRQVILLLHGYSSEPPRQTVTPAVAERARQMDEIRQGVEAIMIRLTTIEEALDIVSPPAPGSLPDYSARIAAVRKQQETALDAGDFKQAGELRDQEKRLIQERNAAEDLWLAEARRRHDRIAHGEAGAGAGTSAGDEAGSGAEARAGAGGEANADAGGEAGADGAEGAGEVAVLRREIERLRGLLRQHGINPGQTMP